MKNWIKAEKELGYKIKKETHDLMEKGYDKFEAEESAKKMMEAEIRLRAFFIHCDTKNDALDNWFEAEANSHNRADFYAETENNTERVKKESLGLMKDEVAAMWSKLEFIRVKSYFMWENKCNMEYELSESEKKIEKKTIELSNRILKRQPYLSQEEAYYCARYQLYDMIKSRAIKKHNWVSERAYYLSLDNPNNSKEHNWYLAVEEFEKKCSKGEGNEIV